MTTNLVAVTVIGNDRPGIVAGVTKALYENGCNLEDATSTILRGHFSMVLIVASPVGASELEAAMISAAAELGVIVAVRPVDKAEIEVAPPSLMVSVYGADKPGIVFEVTEALSAAGANITDLTSRVIGTLDEPVYALMLEIATGDARAIEAALEGLSDRLGVEVTVHPIEADVL